MDPGEAVERALPVFEAHQGASWDELGNALDAAGIPSRAASDVLAFMPLAFGRALLDGMGIEFSPEYAWPDGGGETRTAPLREQPVYAAAEALAARLMETQQGGDAFVAVALCSSEFTAVNEALNHGSQPENLVLGPPFLIPPDTEAPSVAPAPSATPAPPAVDAPSAAGVPEPGGGKKPWWRIWG